MYFHSILYFRVKKEQWHRNRNPRNKAVTRGRYGAFTNTLQEAERENKEWVKREKKNQLRNPTEVE